MAVAPEQPVATKRIICMDCDAAKRDEDTTEASNASEAPGFRALFDAAPTPFLVVSAPDWIIVAVNDARVLITGMTREAQIGRFLFDVFPDDPEDPSADGVEKLTASLERVCATKATDAMAVQRYAVREAQGRFVERWWSPLNSPVLDAGGEVAFIIHRVEDVTDMMRLQGEAKARDQLARDQQAVIERLRASESALQESEAQFRLMADAVPQIVWITDRQGRMEFLNRQFVDYTGAAGEAWTAAEMAARFMHSEDGAAVMAAFGAALATGQAFEIEHRIRSAAGVFRWFLARAVPYRDGQTGGIVKWFGASVDIEERKQLEARLQELNRTLEQRVEARTAERDRLWRLSEDMLARADYTGMTLAVSPSWTRVLGHSDVELLTRPYADFIHPDDSNASLAALARMGETGQPVRFENRIACSDGAYKSVEWTVAPDPDGESFISVGRDVDAERRREAELAEAQSALRQSQKLESMGQLTGGVAHDLNNLLTPIMGTLDLLHLRGVGSDREQRMVDGALQSAERARLLVQRLLAFARRQPLRTAPVDLGALLSGMADLVASTSGPRVRVELDLASDLPAAQADANQLELAILNLAVNARDAMPEGGTLTIGAHADTIGAGSRTKLAPGDYVRLSVADTGLGMDEATIASAVEPFFTTKGVGQGTGLGLSMAHGLASQLGGALMIESSPGLGTSIDIWLPVSTETASITEKVDGNASSLATAETVLVVDDEEIVRSSTAEMLDDLGYAAVEAVSAEVALQLIEGGLMPDLVLTDHLMPGMSGAELAGELHTRRPDLPVMILSGYAKVDAIAPQLPRLAKPFLRHDLAMAIARLRAATRI